MKNTELCKKNAIDTSNNAAIEAYKRIQTASDSMNNLNEEEMKTKATSARTDLETIKTKRKFVDDEEHVCKSIENTKEFMKRQANNVKNLVDVRVKEIFPSDVPEAVTNMKKRYMQMPILLSTMLKVHKRIRHAQTSPM